MGYEYNDYELIYLIKEGIEEAIEVVLEKYDPLIKNIASYYINCFGKRKIEYEDLIQEGRFGLIQAIRTFNDDKDTLFYTFAVLCIKGKMINFLLHNNRLKYYPLNNSCTLDDDVLSNIVSDDFDIDSVFDYFYLEERIVLFKNDLSFDDALIFELKLNSFSYKEISMLLDVDLKKVDNCLYKIKKKFKKFLYTLQ